MKRNLLTAVLMTLATTVLLGILYPLAVTGVAQVLFPDQANGELIRRNGVVVGSRLLGQPFSSARYFHSRPSAAGNGYDAGSSGASNLGPTNSKLMARVKDDAAAAERENPNAPVPVDLVTASASGLDPDISPAAAEFQVARVAHARSLSPETVRQLVRRYTQGRTFGFLGEPRVNVLDLNLALDELGKQAAGQPPAK
ncbi:MAG TPA: potassium-transporting ATPase subunit KdpC [Terriglobales bacterium]|nr:potassium-transporting ATPase subunit KdpC [Terriglobales bacterium]